MGINVLSLCDGMSCGRMALEQLNISVNHYYASEIKETAIKATKTNFPDTVHIGDVRKVSYQNGELHTETGVYRTEIDLVLFGSPCQSFSRAMPKDMRTGLEDDSRSGLFYECYRVLKEVNPKYFLMENVVMHKDWASVITEKLGVEPVRINSNLLTAQNRDRFYWTNIPNVSIPEDVGTALNSILTDGYTPRNKANCLLHTASHGHYNGCFYTPVKRFYRWYAKRFDNIVFPDKESFERCVALYEYLLGDRKPSAKIFDNYDGTGFDCIRYLWKEERARLQGVPEQYVACMSEKEAADLLGDGWTVPVIAHILSGLVPVFSDNGE